MITFSFFAVQTWAENITIAVAANFAQPLKKIAKMYERETGNMVRVSIGSSGKIYAQIINGAPFDLFFSADQEKPSLLIEQDMGVKGSQFTYATGKLALWAPDMELFVSSEKIAVANPKTAPYGLAAIQAMQKIELLNGAQSKLIYAENVAQAYQFVHSGAVKMGFVALSQVIDQPADDYMVVKQADYEPIKQDVILLQRAADNKSAKKFLAYIASEKIRDIIRSMGYK